MIKHRAHTRAGQTQVNYGRNFEYEGRPYHIELATRGYLFELDPPVPITVNLGRIMGSVTRPPAEPVRKPGVVYQPDLEPRIDPHGADSRGATALRVRD